MEAKVFTTCWALLPVALPPVPSGQLWICQLGATLHKCFAPLTLEHLKVVRQQYGLQLTLKSLLNQLCIFPSEPKPEAPALCLLSKFPECLLQPGPHNSKSLQESSGGFPNEASAADFHRVGECLPPYFCACCRQLTLHLLLPLEGCLHTFLPRDSKFSHDHRPGRGGPQNNVWP